MTTLRHGFSLNKNSAKRRLLVYFFTHPGAKHYLRELAVLLEADPANLSRDLTRLEAEGMFRSEMRGHQKYFSLDAAYPLYEALKTIVLKLVSQEAKSPGKALHLAYVIAGPNGAGKTTFAKTFLPDLGCQNFINADLIAGGIKPLAPDQAALKAGKLLLSEMRQAVEKREDFAFETTLAGKSYVHFFRELVQLNYGIHLFFLWLPNVSISLGRIKERVRRGGHHIPEPVARRRFHRGIANLFHLYRPLLQSWTLFDNAGPEPVLVAHEEAGKELVLDSEKYEKIKKSAGDT